MVFISFFLGKYVKNIETKKKLTKVTTIFTDSYVHLGGDEVPFGCWKSNPNITDYMKKNNLTNYAELESLWVSAMIDTVTYLNKDCVVWEEVFNNGVKVGF